MTGGLQEQVTDGKKWFGYGLQPASSAVIGSLQVPYIYEDRVSQEDFTNALKKAMEMRPAVYTKMAAAGIKHVETCYNFKDYEDNWVKLMDEFIEKHGSYETRKNYKRWHLLEVA